MTLADALKDLGTLLLAAGGGGAVAVLTTWKWLVGRADKALDHSLAKRLAEFNTKQQKELEAVRTANQKEIEAVKVAYEKDIVNAKAIHQKDIEIFKGQLQGEQKERELFENRLSTQLSLLLTRENAAHSAVYQRRVMAIEQVWGTLAAWTRRFPKQIEKFNASEESYQAARQALADEDPLTRKAFLEYTFNLDIMRDMREHRPFISDKLWWSMASYRTFLASVYSHFVLKHRRFVPWYRNETTTVLLENVLDEEDCRKLLASNPPSIGHIMMYAEIGIIEEMHRFLSGESDSEQAAARLPKFIARVQLEMAKNGLMVEPVDMPQPPAASNGSRSDEQAN